MGFGGKIENKFMLCRPLANHQKHSSAPMRTGVDTSSGFRYSCPENIQVTIGLGIRLQKSPKVLLRN